jgi:hypothetical protein
MQTGSDEQGTCEEAEIENDFPKKCRKGAKFAAHTAFSARRRKLTDKRTLVMMETLVVRNDDAVGSIPTSYTIFSYTYRRSANRVCHTLSQYPNQALPNVCLKQLRLRNRFPKLKATRRIVPRAACVRAVV